MNILIVYATNEGQTRKVARFMAKTLEEQGCQVTISDVTNDPPDPSDFEFIFVGASIHLGRYQKSLKYFIKENLEVLRSRKTAFFSVCLAVASGLQAEYEEAEHTLSHFVAGLDWDPDYTFHVAGALKYTQYNWLIKLILKNIARRQGESTDTSKDHEYTDWEGLRKDTLKCLQQ